MLFTVGIRSWRGSGGVWSLSQWSHDLRYWVVSSSQPSAHVSELPIVPVTSVTSVSDGNVSEELCADPGEDLPQNIPQTSSMSPPLLSDPCLKHRPSITYSHNPHCAEPTPKF